MDTKSVSGGRLGMLELRFGRELCQHDHWAIKNFGLPKYHSGETIALGDKAGAGYAGHQFVVESMFWSDLMHSWMYYVPAFNFHQCESDLEVI